MNTILVRKKWVPYLWLLPSILLMTIFVVFPILIVFRLSFSEISRAGVIGGFAGLDNFVAAFNDKAFGVVMQNTAASRGGRYRRIVRVMRCDEEVACSV